LRSPASLAPPAGEQPQLPALDRKAPDSDGGTASQRRSGSFSKFFNCKE
jgi:hypothetical protein